MRISSREIEGFHVNPEPDGDSWRCPYCDEPKWGETNSWFNGKPVCSELCLNSLLMVDEYETDIKQGAYDLESANFWLWIMVILTVMSLTMLGAVVYDDWSRYNDWLKFQEIKESLR